jgi:hypothetical protein
VHRIDTAGALPGGHFTDGDVQTGVQATILDADWAEAVQEELLTVIENAGIVPVKGNHTQLAQAIQQVGSGALLFKNLVVNGDFQINNRGTGETVQVTGSTPLYVLDRFAWRASDGGTGTANINRGFFTGAGVPAGMGSPTHYMHVEQVVAANVNGTTLRTMVEGVQHVRARECTLSFWMRSDQAGTAFVNVDWAINSNDANVLSSHPVVIAAPNTWQFYEVTFTFPDFAIAHETLGGGAAGSAIDINWKFPLATFTTFDLDVAQVQLEVGSSASAFGYRPREIERTLCLRYYEVFGRLETGTEGLASRYYYTPAGGLAVVGLEQSFRVPKLKVPTMRWYTDTTPDVITLSVDGARAVTTTSHVSSYSTGFPNVVGPNLSADQFVVSANCTADADYTPLGAAAL